MTLIGSRLIAPEKPTELNRLIKPKEARDGDD